MSVICYVIIVDYMDFDDELEMLQRELMAVQ
jgi:hypothetical protein